MLGLTWGTPFLLFAIYGMIRFWAKPDKAKKNVINWSPAESVGVTLAIYFFSQFIGGMVVFLLPLLSGKTTDQAASWLENNTFAQFLLVLLVAGVTLGLLNFFLKRRQASFKLIGLKKPRWSDLGYVLLGFFVYFCSFIALLTVIKFIIPGLDTDQAQQIGFNNVSNSHLPLVFLSLVILPPFVEEILMRGFLYSGLKKGLPLIWAVLITSAIFAVAHLQAGSGEKLLWSAAIDTFVLSLVLIYLKEKTGSLAAPIGLHMLKNCIAFLGIFVFHVV